jgi:hypothetical protein
MTSMMRPTANRPTQNTYGAQPPSMNQYKPGQAQPQQQSQGEPYQAYTPNANERPAPQQPSAPRRPDFAPPQSDFRQVGDVGLDVMTNWRNPQTGQTYQTGSSNFQPVEGSGWMRSPRGGNPPGGDTMYAGGTPYFNERTGQNVQPPPFQMAPAQTPWGPSMDPFAERDAFVNQINQQRMQNQIAFNSGGPTNPAAGMNPGIDYQLAMQQAGLAGGAPSMSPEYGDSLIARLNSQFGGQGDPFAFANQRQPMTGYNPGLGGVQAPPKFDGIYAPGTDITKLPLTDDLEPNPAYRPAGQGQSPFVNAQGDLFAGSMSFAPGTPEDYRTQAYGNFANRNGYYQQPAYYPGGTMNDGYGMGAPTSQGAPQRRTRSINEIAGDFYDPNPGGPKLMVVQDWHNPQTGEEYGGTGIAPRPGTGWVQGKSPVSRLREELDQAKRNAASPPRGWDEATRTVVEGPPGAAEQYAQQAEGLRRQIAEMEAQGSPPRPQGTAGYEYGNYGRPSQAIPIAPPSQGTPYRPTQPAYQPPAEGTIRVDPGTGKAVTYSNGQWNWRPNPVSGVVAYDASRFGDGPPAPPPRQPLPPPRPAEDDFFVGNWGMMPPSRPSQANPVAPPSRGTPYENPFAQPGRSLHSSEQAEAMRQMQQTGITYPPGLSAKQKSAFNEKIRQSQQAVAGYPAGRSGRRDMKRNQALAR